MRIVAKFSIQDRVKYISHLDTLRAIQRAMARADIPVEFSDGFHPHPKFSLAFALSVGMTSEGEYMDVNLKHPMTLCEFKEDMNRVLPKGISILEVKELADNIPSLASMIERAKYVIDMPYVREDMDNFLQEFLNQGNIIVEKRSKKGIRQIDIRDMIFSLEVAEYLSKSVKLRAILECSGQSNLNPKQLMQGIAKFADIDYDESLFNIHRSEMYLYRDNSWITPLEL